MVDSWITHFAFCMNISPATSVACLTCHRTHVCTLNRRRYVTSTFHELVQRLCMCSAHDKCRQNSSLLLKHTFVSQRSNRQRVPETMSFEKIYCNQRVKRSSGSRIMTYLFPSLAGPLDRVLDRSIARSIAHLLHRSIARSLDHTIARSPDIVIVRSLDCSK